jgi:hypothetical protein
MTRHVLNLLPAPRIVNFIATAHYAICQHRRQ